MSKVLVGHGRVVHEAESRAWPGLTLCGRPWTDEAPDEAPVTCSQCAPVQCPETRVLLGAHGREATQRCSLNAGHRGKHDSGFGGWRWA